MCVCVCVYIYIYIYIYVNVKAQKWFNTKPFNYVGNNANVYPF